MKIRLLKIAQQELDEAVEWYNQQVVGLGLEFLDEFDDSVKLVAAFPEISGKILDDIRRFLINRFPYGIIYGIDGDFIVIIAIAHLRRKPNYWIDRLQNQATDFTDKS
jgi:hypothetical protein